MILQPRLKYFAVVKSLEKIGFRVRSLSKAGNLDEGVANPELKVSDWLPKTLAGSYSRKVSGSATPSS